MTSTIKNHPSLQRRVRYRSDEIYSRYLGINLPITKGRKFCEGRFGYFLDKKLGIKKLPYSITLLDLVSSGCISPKLAVKLPSSYFENWKNFPYCPREGSGDTDEGSACLYSYEAVWSKFEDIEDLIHPYDGELKRDFVERYRGDLSVERCSYQHPNGRKYKAGEFYFSYWQGLSIANAIHKINNIELYLCREDGVNKVKEVMKSTIKDFYDRYSDSFERVSWYRTATAAVQLGGMNPAYNEIFVELRKYREVSHDILIRDLESLLSLYKRWSNVADKTGCVVIGKALEVLRKDVYLVFEQLCVLGADKDSLFGKFSYENYSREWAQLTEVLYFEEYSLKRFFEVRLNNYCDRVKVWGYGCNPQAFDYFSKVDGFYPWVRSLYDLHENIKWDGEADFTHSRIVDHLIVASVRAEVIIRGMINIIYSDVDIIDQDGDFSKLLLSVGKVYDGAPGKVVHQVKCEINKTKLYYKPDNIFSDIDGISYKGWSREDLFFLKSILRFICIRNYFAHHAYKDEEIDSLNSHLALEVIRSMIETLLYFYRMFAGEEGFRPGEDQS